MSKPLPKLTFDQKLKMIKIDIASRSAKPSKKKRCNVRAILWCQWLKREIT